MLLLMKNENVVITSIAFVSSGLCYSNDEEIELSAYMSEHSCVLSLIDSKDDIIISNHCYYFSIITNIVERCM